MFILRKVLMVFTKHAHLYVCSFCFNFVGSVKKIILIFIRLTKHCVYHIGLLVFNATELGHYEVILDKNTPEIISFILE